MWRNLNMFTFSLILWEKVKLNNICLESSKWFKHSKHILFLFFFLIYSYSNLTLSNHILHSYLIETKLRFSTSHPLPFSTGTDHDPLHWLFRADILILPFISSGERQQPHAKDLPWRSVVGCGEYQIIQLMQMTSRKYLNKACGIGWTNYELCVFFA